MKGVADSAYCIMAGCVNNVHRGHVLIQEVAPDGNGIAATAIILFNGDTRCIAGTWRTETATSAEEKNSFEEKRNMEETGFRVECLEIRERQTLHATLASSQQQSFPSLVGALAQNSTQLMFQHQKGALGSDVVFLPSTRESYSATSPQGINGWWGWDLF